MELSTEHGVRIEASSAEEVDRRHADGDGTSFASTARMQIMFKNITYSVKTKPADAKSSNGSKEANYKTIIRNVSGVIKPARITAVMGASGAGKTTFLNMLAGFTQPNSQVEGSICVNQQPISSNQMRQISGFVHQEDVILDTMTVREALEFAAMLKLPSSLSRGQKSKRALKVAALLNLTKSLDSVVGNSMTKGISGGEKRRLSLGMEMITNPSILFLDEPTSGLDTYTAYKVMHLLSGVASSHGCTVVATIHQPSSDTFHLFNDLMVLAEGQVLYLGEVEKMVLHFDALGYKCPTYSNPADFLFMDVLYTGKDGAVADTSRTELKTSHEVSAAVADDDAEKGHQANEARVQQLIEAWPESQAHADLQAVMSSSNDESLQGGGHESAVMTDHAGFLCQFALLARRAWVNQLRNKLMLPAKFGQTLFLSLIVGLVYLNVGKDYKSVQDRQGALFFLAIQSLFGSVMGTVTVFGAEKAVFMREYGSGMYGLPSYFVSRFIVELPSHIILPFMMAVITYWMVGFQAVAVKFMWYSLIFILMDNCGAALGMFISCLSSSLEVVMSIMPLMVLPLVVFSGFFINTDSIPPYFVWISYISPVRYSFAGMGLNEFSGLEVKCKASDPCPPGFSGETVIQSLGFKGTVGSNSLILFASMWAWLSLSYAALWVSLKMKHR